MSVYSSFITEFGIVMFALLAVMLLIHITTHRAWNRTTVCWLVLTAYLYIQFESYAFYALWLLIFAVYFSTEIMHNRASDENACPIPGSRAER
jgi:hypothetical protein